MTTSDIPDISLALHAIRQEGRDPMIVPHSWWVEFGREEPGDYLVLQDDTFRVYARKAMTAGQEQSWRETWLDRDPDAD